MIVDTNQRYIFIHVPKTGGESISAILRANGGKDTLRKHSSIQEAIERVPDFGSFLSFAFVRNPWDQAVSFYEHFRKPLYLSRNQILKQYPAFKGYLGPRIEATLALEVPFQEWCRAIYSDDPAERLEFPADYPDEVFYTRDVTGQMIHRYFSDQTAYLEDASGNLSIDIVGRYETLAENFSEISQRFEIVGALPHHNQSQRQPYQGYFDSHTADIIQRRCRKTLERFSYAF